MPSGQQQRTIAMIELCIALLEETHGRLQKLCEGLADNSAKAECNVTAENISAHIRSLREQIGTLKQA